MGLLWLAGGAARADVFVLENGGRVSGELLNPTESPREKFVVETPGGGRVTLQRNQVKQRLTVRAAEAEYQKIRPSYPDTVDGHWELAQWCLQERLTAQRETHLKRILELEPDHEEVRRLLGYRRHNGKWLTRDEFMEAQGYRRYKGDWKLPQQIDLIEGKRTEDVAEKEWFQKINRWRGWLNGGERGEQAKQNIEAINDPHAVRALVAAMQDDRRQAARVLFIGVLGRLATPTALKALAACSLDDADDEVRLSCLDQLKTKKTPELVSFYAGKLRPKNSDNVVVNRAAMALGQLNDRSAIGPLIEALVTTHKFKVNTSGGGGGPGSMSSTFGTGAGGKGAPPGAGGLSVGGGPQIITQQLANQPVLDALVALTGVNFAFDKQQWRAWYASQKGNDSIDARRD